MSTRAVAIAAALLLVAGACSGSGGRLDATGTTTTTADAGAVADTTTTTGPVPAVEWTPCDGAECATVAVPLDHDEPAGGTIDLFVRRLPATGDRIGALFLNFGGPGAGAASTIDRFPIPADIRSRFDIVGMDPRGVGRSSPLSCGVDARELYAVDHTVEDADDVRALVEVSQRYARDCAARRGPLLAHVGSRDVARDMDLVRAGMGDAQLSYVGFSYGTSIGQAYAEAFPDRVRAMVLDGVVDPAPSGIEVAVQQAVGFETALAAWADGCPSRSSCRFGDDAIAAVDDLLVAAEDGVASSSGARPLGPGEAAIGLAFPLYDQSLWSELDEAVAAALGGDGGGMVGLADRYATLIDFAGYFAVSCVDSVWPDSAEEHLAAAEQAAAAAPRFGEAIVNDYLRCALWPAEPEPLGPITAPGTPPILVVSTTGDPATPHDNGVRVADRLANATLLTNVAEGHTIVFQGSRCIDDRTVAYLIDLVVPAPDTRC